jgi:hypothetical protein
LCAESEAIPALSIPTRTACDKIITNRNYRAPALRESCDTVSVGAAAMTEVRHVNARTVWVAKDDGSDIIRADAITGVGRDYNGYITARLAGEGSAVTLVASGGPPTPVNFHRQLISIAAELSHAAEASVVRPVCDEQSGWHWVNEPV